MTGEYLRGHSCFDYSKVVPAGLTEPIAMLSQSVPLARDDRRLGKHSQRLPLKAVGSVGLKATQDSANGMGL